MLKGVSVFADRFFPKVKMMTLKTCKFCINYTMHFLLVHSKSDFSKQVKFSETNRIE